MRSLAILLYVILGAFVLSSAQNPQKSSPLQIGVGLSANAYTGDLNYQENIPLRAYPGINFSLQFDTKKRVGFQVNSGFARFTEQKDNFALQGQGEYQPNIFVRTNFFYLDARLRYFFFHQRNVRHARYQVAARRWRAGAWMNCPAGNLKKHSRYVRSASSSSGRSCGTQCA